MFGRMFEVKRWTEPYWPEEALRNFNPFKSGLKQDPFNYHFVVPEGWWVIEAYFRSPLEPPFGLSINAKIVGTKPEQFKLSGSGAGWVLLYGKEPFGIIETRSEGYGQRRLPCYFRPARQIHKGELGRVPEVKTPLFAREAPGKVSDWTSKRDRKRGHIGWARLTEVAEIADLTPSQVILDYWDFVDASDREGWVYDTEVTLDMVIAFSRDQIHKRIVPNDIRIRFTRQQVEELVAADNTQWHDFWIRRGFARTVLMLRHFDYTPSVEQIATPA